MAELEEEVVFVDEEEVVFVDDEDINSSADTKVRFHCIGTWKIKKFSNIQLECGEELFSPLFSADSSAKIKWYLSVFPNGQINFEEYISLHVVFIGSSDLNLSDFRASCKLSIIDSELNERFSDRRDQNIERFQFNNFVKREQLLREKNNLVPNDTLTILCQISAFDERRLEPEYESPSETNVTSSNELLQILADDFKALYESGKFSDITIEAGDGDVPAHKIILMARSPVFEALLTDSDSRSVAIQNCDANTTRALMSYIYAGQIHTAFSASSLDLYEVAEKYKIQDLSDAVSPNKIYAETEITNETFTFTWRLRNFSIIAPDSQAVRYSERFNTGPSCRLWSLSISFKKINDDENDRLIGIYLNKFWTSGEKKSVYVHFSICLLDKDQKPRFTVKAEKLCKISGRYGFPSFIKRSELLKQRDKLLTADTLTIRCNMSVCDGANSSKVEHSFSSSSSEGACRLENLSNSFRQLLTSQLNCDVTVCTTAKEFRLHKSVLSARSTVFAEFFEQYGGDGLKNYTINITGIKPEVLEMLFTFIYTGQLDSSLTCSSAPALYMAANHYKIASLKRFCDDFMKLNACEIMVRVSQSSDTKMKELVKDFICSNAEFVFTTEQWPEFVRNHPRLSADILKSLSNVYSEAKRRKIE